MAVSTLARSRASAYYRQEGHCFYCGLPLCFGDISEFASKYQISKRQASHLKCTAEHLIARQDGGGNSATNIVAACFHCNHKRHARKKVLTPEIYRQHVQRLVALGRWHDPVLLQCLGRS